MSQTILPPSPQPEPQPPAQPPVQPPAYYYPTYTAPAVVVAEPASPGYQPDPPKKQRLIWRIVKWPIRQLFKAIYLIGRAAGNHKVIAAILLILVLALVGGGIVGYRYLNPTHTASTSGQPAASNAPDTPFTIVDTSAPPLSSGVIHWLHAYKTYDGQEQWDSLSPSYQQAFSGQGLNAAGMQTAMEQIHSQGIAFEQFIYTGGYIAPTGLATYTVQVIVQESGQRSILTWYFYVDASTDLILQVVNLTPGANG